MVDCPRGQIPHGFGPAVWRYTHTRVCVSSGTHTHTHAHAHTDNYVTHTRTLPIANQEDEEHLRARWRVDLKSRLEGSAVDSSKKLKQKTDWFLIFRFQNGKRVVFLFWIYNLRTEIEWRRIYGLVKGP